jgi:hypothetical protein
MTAFHVRRDTGPLPFRGPLLPTLPGTITPQIACHFLSPFIKKVQRMTPLQNDERNPYGRSKLVFLLYQKGRDSRIFQAQDRAIDDFTLKGKPSNGSIDKFEFIC